MLKYYSTLNKSFYDTEFEAQIAEDSYIAKHFDELEMRAAEKRRKLNSMFKSDIVKREDSTRK